MLFWYGTFTANAAYDLVTIDLILEQFDMTCIKYILFGVEKVTCNLQTLITKNCALHMTLTRGIFNFRHLIIHLSNLFLLTHVKQCAWSFLPQICLLSKCLKLEYMY